MLILAAIIIPTVLLFGFVVLFGAPFVPTLKKQKYAALELLHLKPGETLLELGSGDGRMLKAAAQKGMYAIGYELNPLLVLISLLATWRYRRLVSIRWANYWTAKWPPADGIYTFLLDKYMDKLDKKITQQYSDQNIQLASFAFKIPGKKVKAQKDGVYLYAYHA